MSLSDRRCRKSTPIAAVLLALPEDHQYTYDVARRARVRLALAQRWLWAAAAQGWVVDGWDEPGPDGRSRRWYQVSTLGRHVLPQLVRNGSL